MDLENRIELGEENERQKILVLMQTNGDGYKTLKAT